MEGLAGARGASIAVRGLEVGYGATTVLQGVDLDFARSSFTALLGSSGCGKTTLLRAISGFVPVSAGAIVVEGRDIGRLPPERRGMAMVFQSYALWPHMSVAQNIGYGLKLRRRSREEIAEKVSGLLTMLGLEGYGERKVTALSGGQRQRVALGRALAIDPGILLLDEPLSNLDQRIRMTMRHEIRAIQRQLGLTAIHVTHDREEAMTMADRLVIMQAGRVVQAGTPEEVYDHPATPFVASFMGAENTLDLVAQGGGVRVAGQAEAAPQPWPLPPGTIVAHFRDDAARLADEGRNGEGPPREGALLVAGRVAARAYPGGVYRYRVDVGGREVTVDDAHRLEPGAQVRLRIPTAQLHVFPA